MNRRGLARHAGNPQLQLLHLPLGLDAVGVLLSLLLELFQVALEGFHPVVELAQASQRDLGVGEGMVSILLTPCFRILVVGLTVRVVQGTGFPRMPLLRDFHIKGMGCGMGRKFCSNYPPRTPGQVRDTKLVPQSTPHFHNGAITEVPQFPKDKLSWGQFCNMWQRGWHLRKTCAH